jgi:hypothetical protein
VPAGQASPFAANTYRACINQGTVAAVSTAWRYTEAMWWWHTEVGINLALRSDSVRRRWK